MNCLLNDVIVSNILHSMPLGLMVINPEGDIIVANHALSSILNIPHQELIQKGWGELFYKYEENNDFNQVLLDVIYGKYINHRKETSYKRNDGKTLQLSMVSSYLNSRMDEMIGIVVMIEDITEKYLLHKREKRILKDKNLLEKERSQSLKLFAMSVAHQIRNPLVTIGGFANILKKKFGPNERVYLQGILSQASRLENLVRCVSEYASIPQVNCQQGNMRELVEKCRSVIDNQALQVSKSISWKFEWEQEEFFGDYNLMSQVVIAILRNSLDFCSGSQVSISAHSKRDEQGRFLLEITDSGPGILEQNLPYVFDPFFTTKSDGIGMGLSIVRRIVREHGGEVELDCPKAGGTRISVFLSCYNKADTAQA